MPIQLDRLTIAYLRQRMRDLYYGENANPMSTLTFDYGQDDVECLLTYFLKEDGTIDEAMEARKATIIQQHKDIIMTRVDIIGMGPLWIKVEPWMHHSKKNPEPNQRPITWNDVTRSETIDPWLKSILQKYRQT